ncbi:hypothetical protein OG407_04075 [Streptomyces sp. NBC_01515]|uniref:hypothetical protein n=1 Tax=Streptomyces sp. NBC_01515 TaxID=2903890 RepID=UPI003869A9CE
MRPLLASRPVLWFLFLFNLLVAAVAPFAADGAQAVLTVVGMGAVALGAGVSLYRTRGRAARRPPARRGGEWPEADDV